MSSQACQSKSYNHKSEQLREFCSMTGSTKVVAQNLLEACNNDFELAANIYLENCIPNNSTLHNAEGNYDDVRAPIPPIQEVLIEETLLSSQARGKRNHSVFDGFRDFRKEAKKQEELMQNSCVSLSKRLCTLDELFRPPLDLIFPGTFQEAREAGTIAKKWLLVNVQNTAEFCCQILNRDMWSNVTVKSLIKEHFIFWQVYHDSEEGKHYSLFYNITKWPYIAILDPRTGENIKLIKNNLIEPVSFCDIILNFIADQPSISSFPATSKAQTSISNCTSLKQLFKNLKETDESFSCFKSQKLSTIHDELKMFNVDNEEKSLNDFKFAAACSESNSTNSSNSTIHLTLRYPNGHKDKLALSCNSTLKDLFLYIKEKGYDCNRFDVITNFPLRKLNSLDCNLTLKESGLFPQETVFIQMR